MGGAETFHGCHCLSGITQNPPTSIRFLLFAQHTLDLGLSLLKVFVTPLYLPMYFYLPALVVRYLILYIYLCIPDLYRTPSSFSSSPLFITSTRAEDLHVLYAQSLSHLQSVTTFGWQVLHSFPFVGECSRKNRGNVSPHL
jgi:hypothetical protein